jgi:hypothetical protein
MSAPRIIRRTLPFHGLWLAALKSRLAFSERCVGRNSRSGVPIASIAYDAAKGATAGKPATSND